jgi:hypothetical protein
LTFLFDTYMDLKKLWQLIMQRKCSAPFWPF